HPGGVEHPGLVHRTRAAEIAVRDNDPRPGTFEHLGRRDRDLGLEEIVERVGEKQDLARRGIARGVPSEPRAKSRTGKARDLTLRMEPEQASRPTSQRAFSEKVGELR